jgi:putative DNA primase/helicase
MTVGGTGDTDPRLVWAREYVMRGWRVFVLNEDKSTLPNCHNCPKHNELDPVTGERHDAELCGCLTCHGFYAATGDLVRVELMLERHPRALLGIRTGLASGIVVIDGEASRDAPGEPTGVEVLDDWESWTSTADHDGWRLPPTLRQRTRSGGVHLVYKLPAGVTVKSRNRVLPSVDVKAEGGYVAVPPGAGREWLDDLDAVVAPSPELLSWLHGARGRGRGRQRARDAQGGGDTDAGTRAQPGGYDFDAFVRDGCPAGCRDEFVNEFVFRLRTAGTPRELTESALRKAWERMEQPVGNEYTWNDCLAKIEHVYRTVQPDAGPDPTDAGGLPQRPRWDDTDPRSSSSSGGDGSGAGARNTGGHTQGDVNAQRDADAGTAGAGARARLAVTDVEATGLSPDNPHRNTDRANGIEVARFLRGRALWVPEVGWHVYDGARWAHDELEHHVRLVGDFIDGVRRTAVSGVLDPDESELLMGRATRLESAAGLQSALRWARTVVAVSVTRFDADPWLLNCPNGTLDLRTGELRAHDPLDLLTRQCPTRYSPDARDEVWERVITEALPDETMRRWLNRFSGYCLTGDTREKTFLVAHGPTNTGKSTVAEAVLRTLGDVGIGGYATVWDSEVVQDSGNVNRAEKLDKARAARLVVVGELAKGSRMSDTFVKQYTGGETMDAKRLYRDSYSYTPQGKLWMATNYVPGSPDPALQGRLGIVPFTQAVRQRDPGVKRHLDDDQGAHEAVLAWAVRGAREWRESGTLGPRPWLAAQLAEYALDSDPLLQFLADECVQDVPDHEASSCAEVWARYQVTWAPNNVRRPLLKRKFESAMREHGFERPRVQTGSNRRFIWRGLRLKYDYERD